MKANKYEGTDKDKCISQLKSQIFELEQNEKNFDALNQKFRCIQNEYKYLLFVI